jgi:hypothetical protein
LQKLERLVRNRLDALLVSWDSARLTMDKLARGKETHFLPHVSSQHHVPRIGGEAEMLMLLNRRIPSFLNATSSRAPGIVQRLVAFAPLFLYVERDGKCALKHVIASR